MNPNFSIILTAKAQSQGLFPLCYGEATFTQIALPLIVVKRYECLQLFENQLPPSISLLQLSHVF